MTELLLIVVYLLVGVLSTLIRARRDVIEWDCWYLEIIAWPVPYTFEGFFWLLEISIVGMLRRYAERYRA